mgnify:CR=1 FL=1
MSDQSTDAPIIELEDDWERINAWFLEHDLTDGLPIVPPTEARVAAMTRLGLDYEGVRRVKPDIAYCYAVGFGSKGLYAGRPAFDDVIQGLTAFPSLLAETRAKYQAQVRRLDFKVSPP